MKKYNKPYIEEEQIELEDVIAVSNQSITLDGADEKDPFDILINN